MQQFLNEYLQRGFGSMNKNDFEVFIFNEYRKRGSKSNREMSVELKIPESKVKRLAYEADLKYGYTDAQYKKDFAQIVRNAQYLDKKVKLVIEKIGLRKFIEAELKKQGKFLDSSFNSEIISMEYPDFSKLLNVLYGDKVKEIECEVKGQKLKVQISELAKRIGTDIAGNTIGTILEQLITNILKK